MEAEAERAAKKEHLRKRRASLFAFEIDADDFEGLHGTKSHPGRWIFHGSSKEGHAPDLPPRPEPPSEQAPPSDDGAAAPAPAAAPAAEDVFGDENPLAA